LYRVLRVANLREETSKADGNQVLLSANQILANKNNKK